MDKEYKSYIDKISSNLKDIIKNDVSSGNDQGEAHYLSMGLDFLRRLFQRTGASRCISLTASWTSSSPV